LERVWLFCLRDLAHHLLPFLAALFGRDLRLKGLALGLCLVTLFLTGYGLPEILCWLGAWVFAILAIRARFKAKVEPINP